MKRLQTPFSVLAFMLPAAAAFAQTSARPWDTYSDTWAGEDALGRALPTNKDVGPPRPNKQIGIFYVLNRRAGRGTTSMEKNIGGKYAWEAPALVNYRVGADELVVAVPRRLFGPKQPTTIDFKWADNCHARGDWTDFTLNGDAAPNDRFNYRAKLRSQ